MQHYLIFICFLISLTIAAPFLGRFIFRIYNGEKTFLHPILFPLESMAYRLTGANVKQEMTGDTYIKVLLTFNLIGFLFLFLLQLIQGILPLNPQNFAGVDGLLSFNTAISFTTNTNWQAYTGEATLSYLTDMLGLTVQNFLSAATGVCALLVLLRGLLRKETPLIGNFWIDLVRSIVYILLPLATILTLLLVSQGVIQNFNSYQSIEMVEGGTQIIPMGPAASQVAIKQLGSNGGGFFNANSAHPFENPNLLTNFFESWAIFLIPAALIFTYGEMSRQKKHAWILYFVIVVLWFVGLFVSYLAQYKAGPFQINGPLLEGIETRFGQFDSSLWSTVTTATSNGSVNAAMSSLAPFTGGIALFNMLLGELIFGGIGVGLVALLMYVLLTVFLSGLMVGRTPEYRGKKIETEEIFWVMLAIFVPAALVLLGTSFSLNSPTALSSLSDAGPHGLTELVYAFTSAAQNNGSAFAGLNANTDYYNLTLGVVMLLGRLAILIPAIKIGSLLALKKESPVTSGTFSTETTLFALLLVAVILIVGALSYFPLLALGPLVEHFLMQQGRVF